MNVTECRVTLVPPNHEDDRLLAFASVILDGSLAIHSIKLLRGEKGLFSAMPARRLMDRCPDCGSKNELIQIYCGWCGSHRGKDRAIPDSEGKVKLYEDIAHPITSRCRSMIQEAIVKEYNQEKQRQESYKNVKPTSSAPVSVPVHAPTSPRP